MAEKMPTEAECKRGAALMDRLIPEVFEYANRRRLSNRSFAEYSSLSDVWATYPEGWEENVLGMLSLASVCSSSRHCAGFIRAIRDRLPDDEVAVARGWRELPWIWCAFEVVDVTSGSRIEVAPIGERPSNWPRSADWERLHLYSPTVAMGYRRGITLHLAQLAHVLGAFHAYGVILPFRSFEAVDLLAFADFARLKNQSERSIIAPLAGVADHASRLSDIIADDPLSFLRLIEFVEAPQVAGRSGSWRRNASVVLYRGGVEMSDPVFWKRALAGALHEVHSSVFVSDAGALYLDGGSPLYDPAVYLAFGDRRVFLSAAHEEAYARGREALLSTAEMPVRAQVNCSIIALVAAGRILNTVDELGFLQERLDAELSAAQPDAVEDTDAGLDAAFLPTSEETQAIIERIVHNQNEGIEQSDDSIAEELFVAPETVEQVRSMLPFSGAFQQDEHLPAVDRMGLSPRAFHELLSWQIPSVPGVIALRSADELRADGEELGVQLADTRLMRFAAWLLDRVGRRERIPATQAGYVKPSIVVQAWEAGVVASPLERARFMVPSLRDVPEDDPRLVELVRSLTGRSESDDHGFLRNRELLEHAGLLRLEKRSFIVTEDARNELDDPFRMYHRLMVTMLSRFEWWSTERYAMYLGLRERTGFLLYALHTLCRESAVRSDPADSYGWTSTGALTRAYAGTLPPLAAAIERSAADDGYTIADQVEAEIYYSFVKAFAAQIGLIDSRRPKVEDDDTQDYESHALIRPTGLFGRVFAVGETDR